MSTGPSLSSSPDFSHRRGMMATGIVVPEGTAGIARGVGGATARQTKTYTDGQRPPIGQPIGSLG